LEGNARSQVQSLLNVCHAHSELNFIFTKANADADGRVINRMIDEFAAEHDNAVAFTSLGMVRYLSALKYCSLVIGNSSSGLLEAPSFGVPTVNIGDRQKGRLQANSVLNCNPNEDDIERAITKALSPDFREIARHVVNPYGDGHTSDKIVAVMRDFMMNNRISLKKPFYDVR
jgi:GDP/UDP-N,N'-diacetylbacillosamine 2-epimerase (hydrolysing)